MALQQMGRLQAQNRKQIVLVGVAVAATAITEAAEVAQFQRCHQCCWMVLQQAVAEQGEPSELVAAGLQSWECFQRYHSSLQQEGLGQVPVTAIHSRPEAIVQIETD